MKVIQLPLNPFSMNCYIYFDEDSHEGVIVDPAAFSKSEEKLITDTIKNKSIDIKYILNTHGHLDHILGNSFAKNTFNVPIYLHKDDLFLLENADLQAKLFGLEIIKPPPIDEFISESKTLNLGSTHLKFIHTPGHSPGSVCIIDDKNKNIFCGDLIFKNSIGRTDLEGGDLKVLIDSIKNKLFNVCGDDFTLYPGHMEVTFIREEKNNNPFL